MVIPLIFVGGCLYYLIFTLLAEQLGIPEYIAYHLFPVIRKINLILTFGLPPLFLLIIWWGFVLSHRFAGPLERLEREIRHIANEKDYSRRLRLRRRDDMRPIADAVNSLLEGMERKKQ
jgi:signal transduction histidine kinase